MKTPEFDEKNPDQIITEAETAEAPAVQEADTDASPKTVKKPKKPSLRIKWKTNRNLRIGTTATAITVVVIAAVILLNVVLGILADRFPFSLDLTSDKTYTLSDESRQVAEKVNEKVEITVFEPESFFDSPATGYEDLNTILRQFRAFCTEYTKLTDNKISVTYVDLDANPTLATTYSKYNVTAGSILFLCGTQSRVISLTDLYSVDDSNYSYTGSVTFTSLAEQKLATNINSLCGGKVVTLTFLTGHGEDTSLISSLQSLYELNGYSTESVDFSTAATVDPTSAALIIAGPTSDYTAEEIARLRSWMQNDGNLGRNLFVHCNYTADCPNLYEFLTVDYGITVTDNLIWETDNNKVMAMYGSYCPLTTLQQTAITEESSTGNLAMPLTLQLTISKESDSDKYALTNTPLVTFSDSTKLVKAAELQADGTINDALITTPTDSSVIGMAYAYEHKYDDDNNLQESYVVVSGSAYLSLFSSYSQYTNEQALLTPIRAVCSLGDTIAISGKEMSASTLTFSAFAGAVLGVGVFIIGLPLALIIGALVVFFRRRHL